MRLATFSIVFLIGCGDLFDTEGNSDQTTDEAAPQIVTDGAFLPARKQCLEIVNGSETKEHPGVILIGRRSGDFIVSRCSATLVSKRVVITAAHCLGNTSDGSMMAMIDDCENDQTKLIESTKVYGLGVSHSDFPESSTKFSEAVVNGQKDLAVVVFKEDLGDQFIELGRALPSSGDEVTVVGYGSDQAIDVATKSEAVAFVDVKKREGKNTLDGELFSLGENNQMVSYFYNETTATSRSAGDYSGSSSGDSGGPLIIDGRLAGVASLAGVAESNGDRIHSLVYVNVINTTYQAVIKQAVDDGVEVRGWTEYNAAVNALSSVSLRR